MEQRFNIFIKEHYAKLCATAERFVKNKAVAQDIAQEVLVKFWINPNRDKIASSSDYLFIMVKNASLNYLRSKKRENFRYRKISSESENKDEEFFNLLVEEEYNQLLTDIIDQLPKINGRVIRYALSGYNNKEISILLGISVNTVKSMKYSAIRKLHEYFDNVF